MARPSGWRAARGARRAGAVLHVRRDALAALPPRLIADLLVARGHEVVHLIRPGETQTPRTERNAQSRDGVLYLCGEPLA